MITLFVGSPGSGKTYEAVDKIVRNLRAGRTVCTNIDGMEVEKHQHYLRELAGLDDIEFASRFIFLQRDDVLRFWAVVTESRELGSEFVPVQRHICPPGSLVIIDETHKFFNSRDWQSQANRSLADWASTHRHEGYDVIFITQVADKIDKQVRSLAEWTYFFRKVNFLGGAVKKKYLCYSYMGDDHGGTPVSKHVRTYDPKIFPAYKSYSTEDAKEVGFMAHTNILKHPIFFIIPAVLAFFLYMLTKSSLATGDLFGTNAVANKSKSVSVAPVTASVAPPPAPGIPVTASPLPAGGWFSYHVDGYVTDGVRSVYLIHGRMVKQSSCRNFVASAKTIECNVDLPAPTPSSAPAVAVSSPVPAAAISVPSGLHSGEMYSTRSIPGTDEHETVPLQ